MTLTHKGLQTEILLFLVWFEMVSPSFLLKASARHSDAVR